MARHVLLAEDEAISAMMLSQYLSELGLDVVVVATGEDAVASAARQPPDVALLDICLAGRMDGIEAAERFLAGRSVPIVFMSGFEMQTVRDRAERLSPVAYLDKPIDLAELATVLEQVLGPLRSVPLWA